jgi:MerR family transcriptional regulator, heat shock protein HspR
MRKNSLESTAPVYTLSTASELSGIPVYSIRQYIEKGLIIPYKKNTGRHLFSEVDIMRLEFIHKLLCDKGLNIAGIRYLTSLIPCWEIHKCTRREREKCKAYVQDDKPCWELSEKGLSCRNTDCRNCKVYRIVENYSGIKSFIKTIIP